MLQIGIKCQNRGKIASDRGQMQKSGYNCIKLGQHASIGELHVNIGVILLESGCLPSCNVRNVRNVRNVHNVHNVHEKHLIKEKFLKVNLGVYIFVY